MPSATRCRRTLGALVLRRLEIAGGVLGLRYLVTSNAFNVGGSPVGDSLMLVDATALVGDVTNVEINMSRQAAVQSDSVPTGNAVTGEGLGTTSLVSLWQENCVGLLALAWFHVAGFRSNAVAMLDGIGWS